MKTKVTPTYSQPDALRRDATIWRIVRRGWFRFRTLGCSVSMR